MRLRFDEASGVLKLTCPWRTSRRAALSWALDQREWIEAQLARAEPGAPFAPDAMIMVEGRPVRIRWSEIGRARRTSKTPSCAAVVREAGLARRIEPF